MNPEEQIPVLKERIRQLELALSELKSQLTDHGIKPDSLIILSIDNTLKK